MSDAKKPEAKPDAKPEKKGKKGKKGKLPVILVLAIVLLGGGFFGMKAKSGKVEKKKPAIEIGDHTAVVNLGSFLVNTRDGKSYLKANVLVHLQKEKHLFEAGGHGKGPGIETTAPYVDAIREVLAEQTVEQLTQPGGEKMIKDRIAEAVNEVYERLEAKAEGEKKEKREEHAEPGGGDPLWNSQKGPVLVVYLTDYVWEYTG